MAKLSKDNSLGPWLKERREAVGMTLRDVERATEGAVSNAALSQIENGKIKNPSFLQCVFISGALGIMPDELFERAKVFGEPPPKPDFCPHCGQFMRPEAGRAALSLTDQEKTDV